MATSVAHGVGDESKVPARGRKFERGARPERGDRPPRGDRPQRRALRPEEIPIKKQIDEESEAISRLHEQLAALTKQIDDQRRENEGGEKGEIKVRLDDLQSRINDLESQRMHCLSVIDNHNKEAREKNKALNDARQGVGYKSEAEIDRLINQLEERMETTSMSLKEEKAMMAQLQQLRQAKTTLEMLEQSRQTAAPGDNTVVSMKTQLDDLRNQMNELRKIRKEEARRLSVLNESDRKHFDGLKELRDQRKQISNELKEHTMNKAKLIEQLNELNNAYFAQVRLQQQRRYQKQQQERERRNLEREIKQMRIQLDDLTFLPYEKEIRLLEQVMGYVNRLRAQDTVEVAKVEQPVVEEKSLEAAFEGTRVVPKKQRDEYFIAPKQKSKSKTPREKVKPTLKLDMVTIGYFESCGVPPPTSMDSLVDCLQKLDAKLSHFHELRKDCDVDAMRTAQENKLAEAEKRLEELNAARNAPWTPESATAEAKTEQAEAAAEEAQEQPAEE
ncbi:Brf1p family coiled coil protein, putative [Babesia ovata]|uniref:Brf1p family coiled coil protein, putative n=1 Tax=Babesia ovata TaxID=189622 RepID=A0A2H6KE45_9APIC|nr:Brf1p family coiled coil protein, putative [Babesia ovata]GBE61270.1 Brf1p family coiled coil protein, putative [Babesia ovata]